MKRIVVVYNDFPKHSASKINSRLGIDIKNNEYMRVNIVSHDNVEALERAAYLQNPDLKLVQGNDFKDFDELKSLLYNELINLVPKITKYAVSNFGQIVKRTYFPWDWSEYHMDYGYAYNWTENLEQVKADSIKRIGQQLANYQDKINELQEFVDVLQSNLANVEKTI